MAIMVQATRNYVVRQVLLRCDGSTFEMTSEFPNAVAAVEYAGKQLNRGESALYPTKQAFVEQFYAGKLLYRDEVILSD